MTSAMVWTELKLLFREPLVLVVSLLFPILMMVLLLVSFGDATDDPVFVGLGGTEFYVTSYLAAAVAVMGFMATPTHLAAYRSSGVLRRFRAAGQRPASFVVSQGVVTAVLALVGAATMLTLAFAGFDLPAPRSVAGVVAGFVVGIGAFAAIGVFLGSIMPTARAAQGLGLLLFFGTFFVVGGGPPPGVLPDALNTVAGWTPTGLLVDAIRSPWVGRGVDVTATVSLAAIAATGGVLAVRRLARSA
jgi:ABC-2 type transport system permease protein